MDPDLFIMTIAVPGFLLHWLFFHFFLKRFAAAKAKAVAGQGTNDVIITALVGFAVYYGITLAVSATLMTAVRVVSENPAS